MYTSTPPPGPEDLSFLIKWYPSKLTAMSGMLQVNHDTVIHIISGHCCLTISDKSSNLRYSASDKHWSVIQTAIVSLLKVSEKDTYRDGVVSCNSEVVRKRDFQQVSELGVNMFLLMLCFLPIRAHDSTRQLGHCYSTKPQNDSLHGGQHDIHEVYDKNSQHLRPTGVPVRQILFWSIAVGESRYATASGLDVREIRRKISCKIHITRWLLGKRLFSATLVDSVTNIKLVTSNLFMLNHSVVGRIT